MEKVAPSLPLTNVHSDRICAIRVSRSQPSCTSENSCKSSINIIGAYLPSSDHSINEFNQYLNDLVSIISSLESCGPLIILGDLNAHLNAPTNHQGDLLLETVSNCNLCVASSSCIAKGPGYTFFCSEWKTTVDYILLSMSVSHSIVECYTHDHHDLNFSDHFPISVLLKIENLTESQATENPQVNWRKSLQDGLIPLYAQDVSDAICPLVACGFQSVSELNEEIISVCHTLTQAAFKHLPSIHHRKIKPCIKDSELNFLCKQSCKAWECWKSAGHPLAGPLYVEKLDSKKKVRQFVATCRAREEPKFRPEIHYSGGITVIILNFQSPDQNAMVSRSVVTSALTHKKLQIILATTLRIWLCHHHLLHS